MSTTADAKINVIEMAARMAKMARDAAPPALKWTLDAGAIYWDNALKAKSIGKPVVWTSFCTVPELFYAVDIASIITEGLTGATGRMPGNLHHKYVDIAEQYYVSDHLCTYNKVMAGHALAEESTRPDMIIHPAQPCDSARSLHSSLAEYLGVPHFVIDIPLWKDERAVRYVADEFEKMYEFIEQHTGRKLEYENLKRVVELSNQAHELILKMNELKKLVPSPLASVPSPPVLTSAGTQELIDFCEKLYAYGKAKADRGEGHLPKEKIRLGWFSTGIGHDPGIVPWMEKEFGCVVLQTMLGTFTTPPVADLSSTRSILEGLAHKIMNMPMNRECGGLAEDWINYAIPTVRDYKLDAVFLTLNLGCKNAWSLAKLLKDTISDETGVPTLVFEVDAVDGRHVSGESARAAISDFFQTML